MAGDDDGEKTLDASAKRISKARESGDVPMSREGSAAGGFAAALLAVAWLGDTTVQHVGSLLVPMIDHPEQFMDLTATGVRGILLAMAGVVAIAVLPVYGMLLAGALLPHLLQNSVVFATQRLHPKLGNFSPKRGFARLFGIRGWVEFGKSMIKMLVIATACYVVSRPIFDDLLNLIGLDPRALLPMLSRALVGLLGASTTIAMAIAMVDVPYQRWTWLRKLRMSHQEARDEHKEAEGNPHVKAKIRKMRRDRSRLRMMSDVKTASVVITNPTHFAVALRYDRGKDAAPVVVGKGLDLIAQNIKKVAREAGVPLVEDRPLARALHAGAEIGEGIPREHFEAVAKIIGLIWAQKKRAGA